MKKINECPSCPNCSEPMLISALSCASCEIEVRGRFANHPLNSLNQEQIQFLLLFIHLEGRIRDLESALGISYPTVKAKLANLKDALATPTSQKPTTTKATPKKSNREADSNNDTNRVLESLANGTTSFEDTLQAIKELKNAKRNTKNN